MIILCTWRVSTRGICAGPSANGSGRSPSVMFIIYMVIGFTATLACIMILTLLYFFIR